MHKFGKLTGRRKDLDRGDGTVVAVLAMYDKDNNLWHDLFREYPHHIYMATTDDGAIISWQKDPEQSQICDYFIYGLTKEEAKKRKKKTHFDGEKFYTPPAEEDPTEKRLSELEDKLDKILKLLER